MTIKGWSSILAPREWPYRSPARSSRSDQPGKISPSTGSRAEERLPSGDGWNSRRTETASAGHRRGSPGPRTPARPELGFRSAIGCSGIDGRSIHSARRSARGAPCRAELAYRPSSGGHRTLGANTPRPNRSSRLPRASRDSGSSRKRNCALAGKSANRRRCAHGAAGLPRGPRDSLGVRRTVWSAHSSRRTKGCGPEPQGGSCGSEPPLNRTLPEATALPTSSPVFFPCASVRASRPNRMGPLPHEDRASL